MKNDRNELDFEKNYTSYHSQLVVLGVPEDFLADPELDLARIYQYLAPYLRSGVLKCTALWQIQAFSGQVHYYQNFENIPKLLDNLGGGIALYAAQSSNLQALDWIKINCCRLLIQVNKYGSNSAHYAAENDQVQVLDWIKTNCPQLLMQTNKYGSNIAHSAAMKGSIQALDWIKTNCPQLLIQANNDGNNITHYAAVSGNSLMLNNTLSLSQTPEALILNVNIDKKYSEIITTTLLKALETNYTLTCVDSNGFEMDNEAYETINVNLLRNWDIKHNKVRFIAFLQGLLQKNSLVSLLNFGNLEMCIHILEHLLPQSTDVFRIQKEIIPQIVPQQRAMQLIQAEIMRLTPCTKENKGLLSLNRDSDETINALEKMLAIVRKNNPDIAQDIQDWETEYANTIHEQPNVISSFYQTSLSLFAPRPVTSTKTEECIKGVKNILGIGYDNLILAKCYHLMYCK